MRTSRWGRLFTDIHDVAIYSPSAPALVLRVTQVCEQRYGHRAKHESPRASGTYGAGQPPSVSTMESTAMSEPICSCHQRSAPTGRVALALAIASIVIATGGAAFATPAGQSLILGKSNKASGLTSLASAGGTPLALAAGKGKPPLAVNSSKRVDRLNSDQLDGLDSSDFALSSQLPADLSGYTILVAGVSCPSGSSLVGQGGQYGAENEVPAGFGTYLYRVDYSSLLETYRLERDQAPLKMTACRVS